MTYYLDFQSISELNQFIQQQIDDNQKFKNIKVIGEISNWKKWLSVIFLKLKDENNVISSMIFRSNWKKIDNLTQFKEGDQVVAYGEIKFYPKNGNLTFIINNLKPHGLGVLFMQREKLQKHFEKKGYFELRHKKAIPLLPRSIGIVTANNSAALRDILQTINRRYPLVKLKLFHTVVQGAKAPKSIATAIQKATNYHREVTTIDLLIIARGGGSIEDLWAFNDQQVVENIFQCPIPVITGIGHEIDKSLSDLVADMSASTPTAAAEAATKYTIYDIINSFRQIKKIFQSTISTNIDNYHRHLQNYSFQRFIKTFNTIISAQKEKNHFYYKIISQSNQRICDNISNKIITAREKIISQVNEYDSQLTMSQQKIHYQQKNLRYAQQQIMNQYQQQLVQLKVKLNELQPVNTIYNEQQKKINSVTHVKINQEVSHYLKDGILQSKITNITTHKNS